MGHPWIGNLGVPELVAALFASKSKIQSIGENGFQISGRRIQSLFFLRVYNWSEPPLFDGRKSVVNATS
jgi:hypothetical protein